MTKVLKKFLLKIILMFVLILAANEAILRIVESPQEAMQTPFPPYVEGSFAVGWSNKAGTFKQAPSISITNWQRGRRRTRSDETPPDITSKEVVLLGDESIYEPYLNDQETWAWKLQSKSSQYSIENHATYKYGTAQSYLTERQILKTGKPKVFVYFFREVHMMRNVGEPNWLRISEQPALDSHFWFPFFRLDQAGNIMKYSAIGIEPSPMARHLRSLAFIEEVYYGIKFRLGNFHPNDITKALLLQMRDLAQSNQAGLLVVFIDPADNTRADFMQFFNSNKIEYCQSIGSGEFEEKLGKF